MRLFPFLGDPRRSRIHAQCFSALSCKVLEAAPRASGESLMLERKIMGPRALRQRDAKSALSISQDGLFEGYASMFGLVDLGGDQVAARRFRAIAGQARRRDRCACSGSMIRRRRSAAGFPSRRIGAA